MIRLPSRLPILETDPKTQLQQGFYSAVRTVTFTGDARNACRTVISPRRLQSGCNSRFVANGAVTN